jgi:serine kinase of HPr protein (carbohydrate metabolism regulator)
MNPKAPLTQLFHGTCIDFDGAGVLILGSPGSGKSDLGLRLLDQPGLGLSGQAKAAALVSDDQVIVTLDQGRLLARPPAAIRGLLEVRGLGIVELPCKPQSTLALVVTLSDVSAIERMPEPQDLAVTILGQRLPLLRLDPYMASAPARVRAALDSLPVEAPIVISTLQR